MAVRLTRESVAVAQQPPANVRLTRLSVMVAVRPAAAAPAAGAAGWGRIPIGG